jgi:hypothetical protein
MGLRILVLISTFLLPFSVNAEDWVFGLSDDPITDEVSSIAFKDGLAIVCENGTMSGIMVMFGITTLFDGESTTTYRFDKSEPITKDWYTKSREILLPRNLEKSFFRSVFRSEKVFIRATTVFGENADKLINLNGASEEEITNFADECGIEVDVPIEISTAQNKLPFEIWSDVDNWGPITTQCNKGTLNRLGLLKDEEVNSVKDASLYHSISSYLESFPTLCKNRKKLKIKGLEKKCKKIVDDSWKMVELYSIGKGFSKDKDDYLKVCGGAKRFD